MRSIGRKTSPGSKQVEYRAETDPHTDDRFRYPITKPQSNIQARVRDREITGSWYKGSEQRTGLGPKAGIFTGGQV